MRLMLAALLLSIHSFVQAETLEFLTYTPPPGWTIQETPEGRLYMGRDASGTGIVAVYASRPGNPPAAQAFADYWRMHIEKALPGPPPEPKVARDGDFAMAAGAKQGTAQGVPMNATVAAFVGRGRVFGAMGVATGQEMSRLMFTFLASLRLAPAGATGVAPPAAATQPANGVEIDFDLPPGYVAGREGASIVLSPINNDKQTPCTYGLAPPRASRGSLDADAEAALLEVYPGWQRMDDKRRKVMRGTSPTGWSYVWNTADLWEGPSAFAKRANVMAMAIPAGTGRVHIVWGRGTPFCTYDDLSFVRLLLALRPRGWVPDGGKSLATSLLGTWRWTNGYTGANMMMQYTFNPDGRYILDTGARTQLGITQTTRTSTGDGRYALRGSEIVLSPDSGGTKTYRVRIYEELNSGSWKRVMALVDETASTPAPVEYYRVD